MLRKLKMQMRPKKLISTKKVKIRSKWQIMTLNPLDIQNRAISQFSMSGDTPKDFSSKLEFSSSSRKHSYSESQFYSNDLSSG